MNVKDSEIADLLKKYKKITVIGLSPDPAKASHQIPLFMKSKGYDVVGVYPGETEIAGMKIYPSLKEVPEEYRKFINVFRKSEAIARVVDYVLAMGDIDVLWIQLGLFHEEAEKKAELKGIKVVSNRCLKIEYFKYLL